MVFQNERITRRGVGTVSLSTRSRRGLLYAVAYRTCRSPCIVRRYVKLDEVRPFGLGMIPT
eukprot:scaffold231200_cov16-Prasinocladus_malaysianus.AAC.3